jgi:hypothetical protein
MEMLEREEAGNDWNSGGRSGDLERMEVVSFGERL